MNNPDFFFFLMGWEEGKCSSVSSLFMRSTILSGFTILKKHFWEFPGGPVVRIPRFRCRGPGFSSIPGLGTKIPRAARPEEKTAATLLLFV